MPNQGLSRVRAIEEAVRFISETTGAIARPRFVDLGIGTGALAERILRRLPAARVIGIDADPKMLEEADHRLKSTAGDRLELKLQDFRSELPIAQNAYFAALALHHITELASKEAFYRAIYDGLSPGGIFLNADAVFDEADSRQHRTRWAAHLVSSGFSETEAYRHLQSWREEDRYFGLEIELDLLRKAGFRQRDVIWRYGPMAIVIG